jgi:hypothetical protein
MSLLGLAAVGLWYFAGGTQPLPLASAADGPPRVAAPLSHENLSVYLLYGPDTVADAKVLSLQEALERELAVVHETSNVNMLSVENLSPEYELFIQSGDIVKGGKQDRMAATDMLLPPKSGVVALPAHCVERGRWTNRGGENAERFARCDNSAAGRDVKYANATGQQAAVWQGVNDNQNKLNERLKTSVNCPTSPTSFQLTLEAPAVQAKVAEYEAALKAAGADREGVIGVVFVVNGQVTGAEVYASNALFRKAWPKLLNSAAVEAVAELTDKPAAAPPSVREVEYFLARGAEPEPAVSGQQSNLRDLSAAELQVVLSNARRSNRGVLIENANRELFIEALANPNDEIVQTEGRLPARQTEGRVPSVNGQPAGQPRPTDGVVVTLTGSDGQQAVRTGRLILPDPAPPQTVNPTVAATDNVIMGGSGRAPAQPTAPVNPNGNRLNSNRTENASTLMVESRDPTRQNAVIHRSYLKK